MQKKPGRPRKPPVSASAKASAAHTPGVQKSAGAQSAGAAAAPLSVAAHAALQHMAVLAAPTAATPDAAARGAVSAQDADMHAAPSKAQQLFAEQACSDAGCPPARAAEVGGAGYSGTDAVMDDVSEQHSPVQRGSIAALAAQAGTAASLGHQ
jgi:hypothetical protein